MGLFKRRFATAIELGDGYIKLAQILSRAREGKIATCLFKRFSSQETEEVAAELRAILKEHNLRPKETILSIPRQAVTTRSVKLPSINPRELEEMIAFQALKQIPYPKEEIAYSFNITGVDSEGYSKVMLVICHEDAIERPLKILKGSGINPVKITLSSFGLLNWFNLDNELSEKSQQVPVILIDCDAVSADILVIFMGKLIFTRGITFSSAGEGAYLDWLKDEIDKTLLTYEKETETGRPSAAIFTGIISELSNSKAEFESSLNMKVDFMDSFKHAPSNILPSFRPYVSQASYSSLIGAVFGPEEVDLIPKELKTTKAAKAKKRESTISIILLAFVLILSSLFVFNKIDRKKSALKILESKLTQTTPVAQQIEKMRSASELIKSQLNKKSEALDVLSELHRIVPPQISLSLYIYDEEKVELKGTANVLSDVFKLVTILENSQYFQNVEVRYATKRKIGTEELVDFEISCPLDHMAKGKR